MKLFSWEAFKGLVSRTVASRAAEQDGASASLGLVKEHIDGDYYLSKYPDVRVAVIDPAEHYFHWGWREGRNPTPDFKTNAYLLDHPEVAEMGLCPFSHYLEYGSKSGEESGSLEPLERRDALEVVEVVEVVEDALTPININLGDPGRFEDGAFGSLLTHLFSPGYYRRVKGLEEGLSDEELLKEYLLVDFPDGVVPSPFFDAEYYKQKVHSHGVSLLELDQSPFRHWLVHGIENRVVPTPFYSDKIYTQLNPDLLDYPGWPFAHFIQHGIDEGRRFSELLLLSEDVIGRELFNRPSRVRELFEDLIGHESTSDVREALHDMSAFLGSDLAHDLVTKASSLEPWIGSQEEYSLSIVPPWHDPGYSAYKTIREMLPSDGYDDVILMPFCKLGGSDYVAGVLSQAIQGKGDRKVLILRTDQSDWERPDWFAKGVDSLDISRQLGVLEKEVTSRILYELIREICPKNVFNVNSLRGFNLFEQFGLRLARLTRLHAYYFCTDRTKAGAEGGYPIWFFINILEGLTTALIDNQKLADALIERYMLPKDIAAKVRTIYTPAMALIPAKAIAARQVETRSGRSKPVILWAGRLDRQKRFDLVVTIAAAMPGVQFRCWGKAVLDAPKIHHDLPDNIRMEGTFASFEELPLLASDGWLYTSEWDGVPTVLIECAALGVPITASAVGGVSELITETTGWPVEEGRGAEAYIRALEAMLADSQERVRRAQALQDLARERHTFDSYKRAVADIIEDFGND